MEVSGQLHTPVALPPTPPEISPGADWLGGWVGPRASLYARMLLILVRTVFYHVAPYNFLLYKKVLF
jgi:hypothetical protein